MRQGTQLLTHDVVWFDEPMRTVIADAFGRVIREHGYTCWACAVCSNHAHLVVRVHRDRYQVMWEHLTEASRASLVALNLVPDGHPAWSQRPYSRFCYTPTDVRSRVGYVEGNPEKEGLPRQLWDFVTPYDGWGPGSVAG